MPTRDGALRTHPTTTTYNLFCITLVWLI